MDFFDQGLLKDLMKVYAQQNLPQNPLPSTSNKPKHPPLNEKKQSFSFNQVEEYARRQNIIEEGLFTDRRNSKQINFILENPLIPNLPTDQIYLEYKLHSNFQIYDEQPFKIPNKNHQIIIDAIIKEFRSKFRIGHDFPQQSQKFVKLVNDHIKIILQYLDQGYPQAAFIALVCQKKDDRFQLKSQKLIEICCKTKYPLLLAFTYHHIRWIDCLSVQTKEFFADQGKRKYSKKQIQDFRQKSDKLQKQLQTKSSWFMDHCFSCGLPEAFVITASKTGMNFQKAEGLKQYELLKNAEHLGYEPVAYKKLVFLFNNAFTTKDLQQNLKLCDKYLQKAIQSGAVFEEGERQSFERIISDQKRRDLQVLNSIKSTLDTRSVQVARFIRTRIQEEENPPFDLEHGYQYKWSSPQLCSLFNPPKTFFVVFSPQMKFPGRHFLVKDLQGEIELVSIYNWEMVPVQKLQLLHKLGTKIVLNEYIRKISSGEQLPIYRVDNPHSVEFYPKSEVHRISDEEFRAMAKNLVERGLLDLAMVLYKQMARRKSKELEIVYSNMGLIKQKQDQIEEAIKFYEKSLSIKPFEKSQVRLAKIWINRKQFTKARNLIEQIKSKEERMILEKEIEKVKKDQEEAVNFSKAIKNRHRLNKRIQKNSELTGVKDHSLGVNPTGAFNIKESKIYFLVYRPFFQVILQKKGLNDDAYLEEIQSVWNNIEKSPLQEKDAINFFNLALVIYQIKLKEQFYPKAANYLERVFVEAMPTVKNPWISMQSVNVHTAAIRQNFLESRIEDLALSFEEKGRYAQAEKIYRYAGQHVSPFNAKISQLLYLQQKYEECIDFCREQLKVILPSQNHRFLPYAIEIISNQLKCFIKLKQFEKVVEKGESYIKHIKESNLKLEYETFDLPRTIQETMDLLNTEKLFNSKQYSPKKYMANAEPLLKQIYREIVKALIQMKSFSEAKLYLKLVKSRKQRDFTQEEREDYYQARLLEVLTTKSENNQKCLELVNEISNEVNSDKKLENKQAFAKFLLKQKFHLLIGLNKIEQVIELGESIVKVNAVNLIFVKKELSQYILQNPSKIQFILNKVEGSKELSCLYEEISSKVNEILEQRLKEQKQRQREEETKRLLDLIEKNKEKEEKEQRAKQKDEQKEYHDEEKYDLDEQTSHCVEEYEYKAYEPESEVEELSKIVEVEKYEDEICRIEGENGMEYIVLIEQKLIESLDKSEYHKFLLACDHFTIHSKNSTGIKILADNKIRLKISSSPRLTGKMIVNKENKKEVFLYFDKRQNHDDYKRSNKK